MKIMSATRARAMELIGKGIEFDHSRQKLVLVGRNTFNPHGEKNSTERVRIVRAKNVMVCVHKGFLVGEGYGVQPIRVRSVEFDQRTDQVLALEK